ncbi:MAG: hypothetical protein DPW14_17575 [Planctomycetes bacterium]|nr:hypothetical protein [Planctomycetota bacterium]
MEYKQLRFIGAAWNQLLDETSGMLTIRPVAKGDASECLVVVSVVPGDPPQVTFTCERVTCEGVCELEGFTEPNGSVTFECRCVKENAKSGVAKSRAKRRKVQ